MKKVWAELQIQQQLWRSLKTPAIEVVDTFLWHAEEKQTIVYLYDGGRRPAIDGDSHFAKFTKKLNLSDDYNNEARLLVIHLAPSPKPKEQKDWEYLGYSEAGSNERIRCKVLGHRYDKLDSEYRAWALHQISASGDILKNTLQEAAGSGDLETINLCLTRRSEVCPDDEETGLFLAAWNGRTAALELLVKKFGVDVDNCNGPNRSSALHLAAANGQLEVVKLLAGKLGAITNAKDNEESTPLHRAVNKERDEIVELLVSEYRADVNAKDKNGDTPLHIASKKGNNGMVRLLVEKLEADVHAENGKEQTPLFVSKTWYRHISPSATEKLLQQYEADPKYAKKKEEVTDKIDTANRSQGLNDSDVHTSDKQGTTAA